MVPIQLTGRRVETVFDLPTNNIPDEAAPSKFLASLKALQHDEDDDDKNKAERSVGFSSAPPPLQPNASVERDDRLQIIESLEVGPKLHVAPLSDLDFQMREPNSGIYLKYAKLFMRINFLTSTQGNEC